MRNIDRIIDRDLARYTIVLRRLIRERGVTQMEVQDALGWGRTYISQLLTKHKILRFDHVLKILSVIGVTPGAFFAEIYQFGAAATAPRPHRVTATSVTDGRQASQTPRTEFDRLNALLHGLVNVLENKGIFDAAQLADAIEKARHAPPQWLDLAKDEDVFG